MHREHLAVELNCTIVVLWNMGEGNVKEKFKARGATARSDRSDVALNYSEVTERTRQLKVVKSRYGTRGMSLTLWFSGDMGFEEVETSGDLTVSEIHRYMDVIRRMSFDWQTTRQELVSVLPNEDILDKAVSRLIHGRELRRVTRGVYEGTVSSELPNLGGEDSEETSGEATPTGVERWTGERCSRKPEPPVWRCGPRAISW